ncbi:acetylxylan esterase [Paenibacillus methanolicus]|uniref:Cephalosporin-C deacetylase n=1 Tax=Paenibacillus methanolicus TaxID=582686 RepID=A0A5S5CF12_9BACL|nr:alpha/beta fold hydrolase [Paenibacillus methanolicus]TYP76583.1 cephalosporin-C deacetylase [Paenibacillus methanolicus]
MNAIESRIRSLEHYQPPLTAPGDLDVFWERARREAAEPIRYTQEPIQSPFQHAEVYKVVLEGAANTPLHAWYLLPPKPLRNPIPCIVIFHGYSASKGRPEDYAAWLLMGYAVFAIDVRGQGGETGNGLPQQFGMTKGWITQGILDPEHSYFRAAAIDAMRAVRCAMALPEIDADRVVAFGGSQGGGLALLASALEPNLRAAIAHVPNMCHMDFGMLHSVGSISEASEFAARFPDRLGQVLTTLSYFDIMNVAHWISLPVHVSVGLKDTTCLPETVFAAFNRIASTNKSIEAHPFMGHAMPPGFHAAGHAFFSRWM